MSQTQWNHQGDLNGRFRGGKTAKDRASGAHAARFQNREKPIRQTSSHKGSHNDNKPVTFWGG